MSNFTADDHREGQDFSGSSLTQDDTLCMERLAQLAERCDGSVEALRAFNADLDAVDLTSMISRMPLADISTAFKSPRAALGAVEILKRLPYDLGRYVRDAINTKFWVNGIPPEMANDKRAVLGSIGLSAIWFDGSNESMRALATVSCAISTVRGWDHVTGGEIASLLRGSSFDQARVFALSHLPPNLFTKATILSQCFFTRDHIEAIFPKFTHNAAPTAEELEVVFPGAGILTHGGYFNDDQVAYEYLHSITCMGDWDLMYQSDPESWITMKFSAENCQFEVNDVVLTQRKWSDGIRAIVLARKNILDENIKRLQEDMAD